MQCAFSIECVGYSQYTGEIENLSRKEKILGMSRNTLWKTIHSFHQTGTLYRSHMRLALRYNNCTL